MWQEPTFPLTAGELEKLNGNCQCSSGVYYWAFIILLHQVWRLHFVVVWRAPKFWKQLANLSGWTVFSRGLLLGLYHTYTTFWKQSVKLSLVFLRLWVTLKWVSLFFNHFVQLIFFFFWSCKYFYFKMSCCVVKNIILVITIALLYNIVSVSIRIWKFYLCLNSQSTSFLTTSSFTMWAAFSSIY